MEQCLCYNIKTEEKRSVKMSENINLQAAFLEAARGLKEYAKVNGQTVTKEDVQGFFKGMDLDENKLSMIYGFLMADDIRIADVPAKDNAFLEELEQAKAAQQAESGHETAAVDLQQEAEDEKYLRLYLADLKAMEALSETTRAYLLMNIVEDQDSDSLKLLSESFLEKIVDWIEPYRKKGVLAIDLIQEANLAMMTYIGEKQFLNRSGFKERIREGQTKDLVSVLREIEAEVQDRVAKCLALLIDAERAEDQITGKVLNKVNLVNDWAVRLKESLGRKPTSAEVAEKMGVSVAKVEEAIQLSGEAIEDIQSQGG